VFLLLSGHKIYKSIVSLTPPPVSHYPTHAPIDPTQNSMIFHKIVFIVFYYSIIPEFFVIFSITLLNAVSRGAVGIKLRWITRHFLENSDSISANSSA